MTTLLLATRNAHKVDEIRAILGTGLRYQTLDSWPRAPELIEDADSFAGNATRKAVQLAQWISRTQALEFSLGPGGASPGPSFVLADDSGLEVDALHGAPGVRSARFAALDRGSTQNSSATENNDKLLRLLAEVPAEKRSARFRCVIALTPILGAGPENTSPVCFVDEAEFVTELFNGTCEGRIGFLPRGTGGFGYDPLFIPLGFDLTFAELGEEVKNRLSHRAKALTLLKDRFKALRPTS